MENQSVSQVDQDIFNYVSGDLLEGKELSEDQISQAFVNIMLWLESKEAKDKWVKFIEDNKTEAISIATDPMYERNLIKESSLSISNAPSGKDNKDSRIRIGVIVAAVALGLYLLMKTSDQE